MKIEKTFIKDKKVYIEFDSANVIDKFYLDSVDNDNNMYSSNDTDHLHIIVNPQSDDYIHYTIDLTDINDNGLIVTAVSDMTCIAFAINEEAIYYSKIELFTSFCLTCLDNSLKEKILICELRSNLLKYAVDNNLLNDAVQHYKDLDRILNLNSCYKQCNSCANGMCTL